VEDPEKGASKNVAAVYRTIVPRDSREECSEKTSQAVQQKCKGITMYYKKTAQKIGGVECWHKNVGRIMLVFWEQDTITCQSLMERHATKVYAAEKM
jgi:hypothetical protein